METIPLFPLSTVLLPHGRMALQIFEPRYLDLVSRCLKHDDGSALASGFGVVWLREGAEVYQSDDQDGPRLAQIGTYAKIVDWDSLSNGLLGITIEGTQTFRMVSSYQRQDYLHMAEVEWLEEDPLIALPEQSVEMKGLLLQLLEHPHVLRMKLSTEVNDVGTLAYLLIQLLPIAESVKFQLLTVRDPLLRLQELMDILDQIAL